LTATRASTRLESPGIEQSQIDTRVYWVQVRTRDLEADLNLLVDEPAARITRMLQRSARTVGAGLHVLR